MGKKDPEGYDPRPLFDIRLVPLHDRYQSVKAMKAAAVKAAFPDLAIAGIFLYAMVTFLNISPDFKSNLEGIIINELIVLILFPVMFRIFASEERPEFRASRKLGFMTGWINVFNIVFVLTLMIELALLTSLAPGRLWIPMELFVLAGTKVYSVFFSGEKKVSPLAFCARLTARLVGGLFCGIFAYFFAAVAVGIIFSPEMLHEVNMLLLGFVYFAMMGIYTLFKNDFLYITGAPFKTEKTSDGEMICEIWYPRLEIPKSEFKIPPDAQIEDAVSDLKKKPKSSYAFVVLLATLLLPAVCMLPLRSNFNNYTQEHGREISNRKIQWEDRFNLGAMVIFPTCMLWIFFVVPMMMIRENKVRDPAGPSPLK